MGSWWLCVALLAAEPQKPAATPAPTVAPAKPPAAPTPSKSLSKEDEELLADFDFLMVLDLIRYFELFSDDD